MIKERGGKSLGKRKRDDSENEYGDESYGDEDSKQPKR